MSNFTIFILAQATEKWWNNHDSVFETNTRKLSIVDHVKLKLFSAV